MNAGWQVLDFTSFKGTISYSRGQLRVLPGDSDDGIEVPLSPVAVVLVGVSASVSGAVLSKLSEYDIALLVCDWRGIPVAGACPWAEHTRIGARHLAQSELSRPRKKAAWARIISAKIKGQASTLKALDVPGAAELIAMGNRVRSGDPDNLEAQAARRFWSLISEGKEFSRVPGAAAGSTNSALDYGYTILRGFGIRAVASAGLCPSLGVFHHGRSNQFNLVDDLIEPFRPVIDHSVFSNECFSEDLNKESKQLLVQAANSQFSRDGEPVPTAMSKLAQNFGRYVEDEVGSLDVPIWKGPFDAEKG
ncbi:type II CRISPR-associated endonuclease Cas1 [Corynebacterium vitaeruminis]|uniref:CRISPR-associated endonuclease Cas1 n=1 Tax=Corynebacterium vitaeruminis DSM 20294 TaxID=1224164 RepID=W5YA85_9CORY|nr:type II CRISPR-associated endonuclease Cas1 [Corynebacterium vitaeruminis]AHI23433.1 hypothetical protein B843_10240 [Corynebacterium vitaeruminis DSM 20294]